MVSPLEIADVVELRAWATGQEVTLSQLEGDIETSIPEEMIDYDDAEAGEPYEILAQQVFDELLERQYKLGSSYPFACDGYKVSQFPANRAPGSYIFCLLLSYLPSALIDNDQRTAQFESLVAAAAKNFFGGSAMRIGWPWERPTYAELLEDVVTLLPNLGQVSLPEPVTAGDRGWDVLVVKGFRDGHFPKLIVLGNCATGRSNWRNKGRETGPEYFWRCFQHEMPGTWFTFFAVPFRMGKDIFSRKGERDTMAFDRYRICENASVVAADVQSWCSLQKQAAKDIALDASI